MMEELVKGFLIKMKINEMKDFLKGFHLRGNDNISGLSVFIRKPLKCLVVVRFVISELFIFW